MRLCFWGTMIAMLGGCAGGGAENVGQRFAFEAQASFALGQSPLRLAVGDFNGDRALDVMVVNEVDSTRKSPSSVLFGDGKGYFTTSLDISLEQRATALAADWNGDGISDLVLGSSVSTSSLGQITLLLGDKAGTFAVRTSRYLGLVPVTLTPGDWNGDGKLDLTATETLGGIYLFPGDGVGGFGTPFRPRDLANQSPWMLGGDFNGDGHADLLAEDAAAAVVLLGDGTGGFADPRESAIGTGLDPAPVAAAVRDFGGDGKDDLITIGSSPPDTVRRQGGDGAGGFGAPRDFAVGSMPVAMAVADFDGDGWLDLVTANAGSSSIGLLPGDVNNGFGAYQQFPVSAVTGPIEVGDFNGDGRPDLVLPDYPGKSVMVLLNRGTFGAKN